MIGALVSWLFGGGISALSGQFMRAYELKLSAQNSEQRLAADLDMARIEAMIATTQAANADRWSATSLGRYLIVLPFGLWWTAIFLDSTFDFTWIVLALPQNIMDMALWLVPAIVVGDMGKTIFRRR